ncbi:hypothetical protein [Streptomyces sp. S1D4-14]|uniref:hypothetical protein n=1 Tax=Streptomyces sp. S1D4-14 TaxID=2594461 RepID=UPI0011633F7B|nr:hypothetical protein [Streptomyces sp. S1D4-14]QDN64455.1 hypothetical protein FNV66_01075 [Streptomyces sp. S1D4-14]
MDWTTYLTPALGASGLLAAVVLMVLTGRLLPKASVDERLADRDRQIETWRAAYERGLEVQDEQRKLLTALVEANETATKVIQAIPRASERPRNRAEGRRRELAADTDQ